MFLVASREYVVYLKLKKKEIYLAEIVRSQSDEKGSLEWRSRLAKLIGKFKQDGETTTSHTIEKSF